MQATSTKARLWANGWMPLTTGDGAGESIEHPDGEVVSFPNLVDAERFADAWNAEPRAVSDVQDKWRIDADLIAQAHDRVDAVVSEGRGLDRCPVCGGDDLDYSNVDIDDGAAYQPASCSTCDASWVEAYTFNRIIDVQAQAEQYLADVIEAPLQLRALAWMLDEYAQGRGEGDPRVQLAAALLADAHAATSEREADPVVPLDFAHYLLNEYAEEKER